MSAAIRIYAQSPSLQGIHEEIARLESNGWRKAGGLVYVANTEEMGWECAMEIDVEVDTSRSFFRRHSDGTGDYLVFLGIILGIAGIAGAVWWLF